MTSSERPSVLLAPRRGRALRRARAVALFVIGGWVGATARPAHAQRSAADIESAREIYNQGIELRDAGDLPGALVKLRAAHALGNTPITGVELCKLHVTLTQPVEAREVCLGVARIPPLAGETSRSHDARVDAARIAEEVKPRIAKVRFVIAGVPQGGEATVVLDGAPVAAGSLGEPRAMNPGHHQGIARVSTGPESAFSFDVVAGEARDVPLRVQAPDTTMSQAPKPDAPRSSPAARAAFVFGGLGLGLGIAAGIVAVAKKSELDTTCPNHVCGPSDYDSIDAAKRWATISTVALVAGGAALGIGFLLSGSTRAPARATASVGLGGVGVRGEF